MQSRRILITKSNFHQHLPTQSDHIALHDTPNEYVEHHLTSQNICERYVVVKMSLWEYTGSSSPNSTPEAAGNLLSQLLERSRFATSSVGAPFSSRYLARRIYNFLSLPQWRIKPTVLAVISHSMLTYGSLSLHVHSFSSVSIIPPLLYTQLFTYHRRHTISATDNPCQYDAHEHKRNITWRFK